MDENCRIFTNSIHIFESVLSFIAHTLGGGGGPFLAFTGETFFEDAEGTAFAASGLVLASLLDFVTALKDAAEGVE